MKQTDKELLLKDLSARLPYNPIVEYKGETYNVLGIVHGRLVLCKPFMSYTLDEHPLVEEVKSYLFPISSMTEEQYNEMYNYCYNAEREASKFSNGELKITYNYELIKFDYLNRNNFDYRGLIPKGLAKDASRLNIY